MALPLASPSLVRLPPGTPRGHTARTPSYALRALRTPGGGGGADGQPPGSPGSWMAGERPNPFDDVRPQGKRSSSHARSRDRSSSDDDEEGRDDHAGSEDELVDADGEDEAEREPLERAINLVGMGSYQWRLLVLCGFGWLCDNMYLQCIAVILPRVQDHFGTPSSEIGTLTSATMLGMMLGAVFWGALADLQGRRVAFRATLGATAVFGLGCSWAGSFSILRLGLFFLGFNVGGSMPTDGTILLENLPRDRQYLLTFLSTFFSLGAITSSLMGLVILPTGSCPEGVSEVDRTKGWCGDFERENWGWRWMLRLQGALTVAFFLARLTVFRIKEAPRFLAAAGRPEEAAEALRYIAAFNRVPTSRIEKELENFLWAAAQASQSQDDDESADDEQDSPAPPVTGRSEGAPRSTADGTIYASTASTSPDERPRFQFATPTRDDRQSFMDGLRQAADAPALPLALPATSATTPEDVEDQPGSATRRPLGPRRIGSRSPLRATATPSRLPSAGQLWEKTKASLAEGKGKLLEIFRPDWRRTTILIWIIWSCLSMAYTMFNAFLPTILEARIEPNPDGSSGGRREALEEYLIYTVAGAPGSLLGAYLIETPFGRRKTLAGTTLVTALAMFLFSAVSSKTGVVGSSMAISLASTAMYAVLYGMTPEIFSTEIRGTACGSAAATSRLAGIVAPLITGSLLAVSPSLPLWTSAGFFLASVGATVLLPFERAEDVERSSGGGDYRKVEAS